MCAGPDAKMAKTPAAAAAAPAGGPPAHLTVAGVTYDVSEFQRRHPGGTLVLQPFLGQDATHQFTAFHSKEAWNLLRTLPRVEGAKPAKPSGKGAGEEGFDAAVHELRGKLVAEGAFKADMWYYARKVAEVHALVAGACALLWYGQTWLGAALLGLFFQQVGWLAHDFLHQAVFSSHKMNSLVGGWYLGALAQGFSGAWWNEKHFRHHALPNGYLVTSEGEVVSYDDDVATAPLILWVKHLAHMVPEPMARWMLPYQHIYTGPFLLFAKANWNMWSLVTAWGHLGQVAAIAVHYAAFIGGGYLLAGRDWQAALCWYVGGLAIGGFMLAYVFLQSHTATEVLHGSETGFYSAQMRTTRNVSTDPFTTWFTGGLNFQIEHHLFPRLPRHTYHAIAPRVRAVCDSFKVKYEEISMLASTTLILRHLHTLGQHKLA